MKDLHSITGVRFEDVRVDGTGTSVVSARAAGSEFALTDRPARALAAAERDHVRRPPPGRAAARALAVVTRA